MVWRGVAWYGTMVWYGGVIAKFFRDFSRKEVAKYLDTRRAIFQMRQNAHYHGISHALNVA